MARVNTTMKIYTVQDLANYNRVVSLLNGHVIKFNGHAATVAEEDIDYFNRIDDFQVSSPRVIEDTSSSQTTKAEPIKPPAIATQEKPPQAPIRQYIPTASPNIKDITSKGVSKSIQTKLSSK